MQCPPSEQQTVDTSAPEKGQKGKLVVVVVDTNDAARGGNKGKLKNSPTKLAERCMHLFLPRRYPQSVTPGYLQFAGFNAISAVLSSAGGVLSMQTLLYALGLCNGETGVASTLPLAATLNWILKDGLGQAGTILFASFINNRFDRQPKFWRFQASAALEMSNVLEICTAFFPAYFLPIAAIANMGKNISFLASSASRASIHRSFAKEENLADITAKTGSQNILSSFAGTSLGIAVSAYCGNDIMQTCACFSVLSLSSLAFTFSALRYATITALTQDRLDYILDDYFVHRPTTGPMAPTTGKTPTVLLSPEAVKDKEEFFILPSITEVAALRVNPSLEEFQHILNKQSYGSGLERDIEFWRNINTRFVIVPLKESSEVVLYFDHLANMRDALEGFVWAFYVRLYLHQHRNESLPNLCSAEIFEDSTTRSEMKETVNSLVNSLLNMPEREVASLSSAVGSQWVPSSALLECTENRIEISRTV
jgi:hypothetical protein